MTNQTASGERLIQAFQLHKAGMLDEAIAHYRAILEEEPDQVDALRLLASAERSRGDLAQSLSLYARALRLAPEESDIWYNLGNALGEAGRKPDALEAYQRAAQLAPDNAPCYANIGVTHADLDDYPAAIAAYRQALVLDPQNRIALHNLGNALAELGEAEAAMALLSKALEIYPSSAEAHYNLGINLLRLSDYTIGFAEYEWRWQAEGFPGEARHTEIADWNGRPFQGKRLLVHAEQGLGDTIQFVKLLPLVKSLGGEVILQVPNKLVGLLAEVPGADRVQAENPPAGSVDFQVPLLGLPHRLKLTPGSVPKARAYLQPQAERVSLWRERLDLKQGEKALGFVWRGNPLSPAEKGRSLAGPEQLSPFAGLGGTRLIALQKLDEAALEPADTPSGYKVAGLSFTLEHPGPDFDAGADAFLDTAAILTQLSAFVSVCTAPLHLAGSLGVPTIGLLKKVPDWRWGTEGRTSPWYPSIQLCRQTEAGDFSTVIAQAVSLAAAITNKS
ncbi:tetratricopeptide repeat-containing glycosyltransferase family protein [Agrobacterium vitis]|uniref:tetratricopeptide repeat protein n=1 Tax=Agrobacterium vitis TaxID=373 RepID=UPI0012E71D5A|nr:tetratricopeptide repeat protein [Agrobacterium vitis]MVA24707.1 tetratricopeptide repeat protein [Agrobacterium vitis]